MPNDNRDIYKIAVLGDEGSGKTALLVRFLTGRYIVEYDPTIEDTYRKIFLVNDEPESVDILDTTRTGKDSPLRKEFLSDGDAFVIVYSITDRNSFEKVEEYATEIRESRVPHKKPYKISLVGNKNDLEKARKVSKAEGQKLASEHGWLFCEASAAENTAISEVFFGLNGVHHGSLADVLGSSSDSDSTCSTEKHSKKKRTHRKKADHHTGFSNFHIFRWHSQP